MKIDEQIALVSIMVAERWDLSAWLDVHYDAEKDIFKTSIILDEETPECEITTLEDAATLLVTEQEFIRNVKKLIETGTLERSDIKIDWIMDIAVSRINRENKRLPYSLVTLDNWVSPTAEDLPQFTDQEKETGLFALKVLKQVERYGYWNDVVSIRHEKARWDSKTGGFVPVDPYFTVSVSVHDLFLTECEQKIVVKEHQLGLLKEVFDEVRFRAGKWENKFFTVDDLAAWLFACHVSEFSIVQDSYKKLIPESLTDLFSATETYTRSFAAYYNS